MLRNPKIGDRVRIAGGIGKSSERRGDVLIYTFDASLNDQGVIINILHSKPRGHSSKYYHIQLDPPNFGVMVFFGTFKLEPVPPGSLPKEVPRVPPSD